MADGPEWKCVIVLVDRAGQSSKVHNTKVKCIFCEKIFCGSSTRIRAHFLHITGVGVSNCTGAANIPSGMMASIKGSQQLCDQQNEAKRRKRKLAEIERTQYLDLTRHTTDKENCMDSLARFFYAEAIPFRKVESPYFRDMVNQIRKFQSFTPPSRDTVSTTLLDKEYTRLKLEVLSGLKAEDSVTLLVDGWKNCAGFPLTSFLAATVSHVWYLDSFQTDGERKTGDLMLSQTAALKEEFPCNVVQMLSDSGSDAKNCRKQVEAKYPGIVTGACVSHTLDLLIEDILELNWADEIVKQSKELNDYIRNHNLLKSSLLDENAGKSLLHPCDTRFATNVLLMDRLNDSKDGVVLCLNSLKADEFYQNLKKSDQKKKFTRMQKLSTDRVLWENLTYVLRITLPILHIIRICDNMKDLEITGFVYYSLHELDQFISQDELIKSEHRPILQPLLASRWVMLHSPLHDAGFLLNPKYHHLKPWTNEVIMSGFQSLITRWLSEDDRQLLLQELDSMTRAYSTWTHSPSSTVGKYIDSITAPAGVYSVLETWGQLAKQKYTTRGTLVGFWNLFGARTPKLQWLANRLYRQPVSQSAVEQLFSQYDYTMSKRRNKLSAATQKSLMFCKFNLTL